LRSGRSRFEFFCREKAQRAQKGRLDSHFYFVTFVLFCGTNNA